MVSTLTDRIFSGYSSSETNSSTGRRGNEPQSNPTTDRDSGGYSADLEHSAGTPPPFYIDFSSHHGKRHASGESHADAPDEKKKRIQHQQEMNYIAHNARHEISRGGLRYPKMNVKKPRLVPGSIDTSKVSLVTSKDFAKAHKRHVTSSWNVTLTMSPDLCLDALSSMIKSCSEHYRGVPGVSPAVVHQCSTSKPSGMEGDSSDGGSTTSSVTEDGVDEVAGGEVEADSSKIAISMGQALTISKRPRIIVIAEAPYTLVHCNAAFLEMTDIASSKVLGHPLVDALDEQTLDEGMDFWSLQNQNLHLRCTSSMVSNGTPNITCRARLSPIGPQPETATHISIKLDPPSKVKDAWDASDRPIFMPSMAEETAVKVVA